MSLTSKINFSTTSKNFFSNSATVSVSRQQDKHILIGHVHGFVDLVFYHRILKCHVLIELKLDEFSHENIGQLNTYVSWYQKNVMAPDDNPPIGILLCAAKDHALVEYALAGLDNQLFVSKYQLHLPDREQLRLELERLSQKREPAMNRESQDRRNRFESPR